jgi:hypothetical protein
MPVSHSALCQLLCHFVNLFIILHDTNVLNQGKTLIVNKIGVLCCCSNATLSQDSIKLCQSIWDSSQNGSNTISYCLNKDSTIQHQPLSK